MAWGRFRRRSAIALAAFATLASLGLLAQEPRPIHIGLAKSFLSEQPKGVAEIAADDLKAIIKKTTGLAGDVTSKYSAGEIAAKLDDKKLDFGIFHSYEFAWAKKKHADLKPLLLATDGSRMERAYLIVNKNCPAKSFADLRGKKLDIPAGTKDLCRVYVDRLCKKENAKTPGDFFSAIDKSATKKDALDAVAGGTADAVLIDRTGVDFYKEIRGPVYEKHLRILTESADFPPAVVAYRPGDLDAKTVEQFRAGLLKAHTIPEALDMMKTWNIQKFEPVPKEYAKELEDLLKTYPPP